MHELKLIVDLLHEGGIWKMHRFISETAKYGDLTRGPRVVTRKTKTEMKKILQEIQQGKFASEWMQECKAGQARFKGTRRLNDAHQIEEVGAKLRAMMPWIKAGALVDKAKN